MKTIACLAVAAAVAAAAPAGLGCRSDPPRKAPADPAPVAQPAPGPTAMAETAPAAPAPAAPTATASAPVSPAYASDIEKLCDVVRLSGAEAESPEDRRLPIANWLAANLTTTESRQFLAQIQPLDGGRKADALEAEAKRVGLAGCNLAAEWRVPAPR